MALKIIMVEDYWRRRINSPCSLRSMSSRPRSNKIISLWVQTQIPQIRKHNAIWWSNWSEIDCYRNHIIAELRLRIMAHRTTQGRLITLMAVVEVAPVVACLITVGLWTQPLIAPSSSATVKQAPRAESPPSKSDQQVSSNSNNRSINIRLLTTRKRMKMKMPWGSQECLRS